MPRVRARLTLRRAEEFGGLLSRLRSSRFSGICSRIGPGSDPHVQSRQKIRFCTSADGTRIAYATCGSGPPLVWVQPWTHHLEFDWDSPVWAPWLSLLARHHTLVRYDWRGCGLSDRERVRFLDRYAEDLDAVIAAAGLDRFVLFGMSGSGGAVTMTYAVHHPGRVTHLVLLAAIRVVRWGIAQPLSKRQRHKPGSKSIELGWANENPGYGQFFASLHIPDATIEQCRSYNDLVRRTTSPANAVSLLNTFNRINVQDIVPKVPCPTLVLHSRGDAIISFDQGRKVAALMPGARFAPWKVTIVSFSIRPVSATTR